QGGQLAVRGFDLDACDHLEAHAGRDQRRIDMEIGEAEFGSGRRAGATAEGPRFERGPDIEERHILTGGDLADGDLLAGAEIVDDIEIAELGPTDGGEEERLLVAAAGEKIEDEAALEARGEVA